MDLPHLPACQPGRKSGSGDWKVPEASPSIAESKPPSAWLCCRDTGLWQLQLALLRHRSSWAKMNSPPYIKLYIVIFFISYFVVAYKR
jgi:hypothetical protein